MTNRRESSGEEHSAQRLAALLRDAAPDVTDPDFTQTEWQRLLIATHREDATHVRRKRFRPLWLLVPLAAGAVLLAVGLLGRTPPADALRFQLDGREPAQNYFSASPDQSRRVDFSDGSQATLRPLGRMRVTGTHAQGARLSLERGELELAIRHRRDTRWQLDAGPYGVQVTGTRFNVSWDPDTADFHIALLEGSVNVTGPTLTVPITLDVGQELHARAGGSYAIEKQAKAPSEAPVVPAIAEPQTPETARAASTGKRLASAAPVAQEKRSCDWTGLMSTGQFATIIAQARRLGMQTTLAECPTRSLFALADSARYVSNFALSRRTLMAASRRSPEDAMKAAFFLGRLEEARGNERTALAWYTKVIEGDADSHYVKEAEDARARVAKLIHSSQPSGRGP